MKLAKLKQLSGPEQITSIIDHERIKLIDALKNPEKFRGKILCFIGNYAGFQTDGVVIRKFVYNFEKETWTISDEDLSDGFEESYNNPFAMDKEMEYVFGWMYDHQGYLLDSD